LDGLLVVDVLSVKIHPKLVLQQLLPKTCDILCTHPMFGPESGKDGWAGLPFVYEVVRATHTKPWRINSFLNLFASEGCRMVSMTCAAHDECAAGSQFITHFTGRVLSRLRLQSTPINTKGYETLLQLCRNTVDDSFDLFFALYKENPNSVGALAQFTAAVEELSLELRAGELAGGAYRASSAVDRALSPLANRTHGSPTVRLHALTIALKAEGKDIAALNVGEPDWAADPAVRAAAQAAIADGRFPYDGVQGSLAVRQAICRYAAAYAPTNTRNLGGIPGIVPRAHAHSLTRMLTQLVADTQRPHKLLAPVAALHVAASWQTHDSFLPPNSFDCL